MDSKLVIEQMAGRWKIKHPDMKPLALQAARLRPAAGDVDLGAAGIQQGGGHAGQPRLGR
jgi:ribonuclease HI